MGTAVRLGKDRCVSHQAKGARDIFCAEAYTQTGSINPAPFATYEWLTGSESLGVPWLQRRGCFVFG